MPTFQIPCPRPISSGLQVWCILAIATDASLRVVFQNVFDLMWIWANLDPEDDLSQWQLCYCFSAVIQGGLTKHFSSPTINGWNLKLTRLKKRKSPSKPSFFGGSMWNFGQYIPIFQLLDGLVCPRHSGMNWWRRLGRNCKPQGWRLETGATMIFSSPHVGYVEIKETPKAVVEAKREQLFRS